MCLCHCTEKIGEEGGGEEGRGGKGGRRGGGRGENDEKGIIKRFYRRMKLRETEMI